MHLFPNKRLSAAAVKAFIASSALSIAVLSASIPSALATQFVTLGTGGVTGVYYPAGGSICRLVNKSRKEHGIRCSVESTGGSVFNIRAIREADLDLGVVQSDWQFHAYNGSNLFVTDGPFKELRALFSIHPEPFTVVARADSGITRFDDLKGKRVNVGNPGSGQRGTLNVLMAAKGWTMDDFSLVSELKSSAQSKALCSDQIDAMVFAVGHPSGSIKEATTSCNSVMVEVSDPIVDQLIKDNEYYRKAIIPGGIYSGNDTDTRTFGVGATLVSSTGVSEEVIYQIVKAVFDNFDDFKRLHPAFAKLTKEEMVHDGLSAPLHAGAIRYYKEQGLL